MDYVNLGSTGLKVSRICLGTMTYGSKKWREWVLEEEESRPFIKRALEGGINFFDTADAYSTGVSEEILGRALKDFGPSRDSVVIATKVFNPMGDDPNQRGLSRKHIRHGIDDSLRRLKTDYIDLYQIHRFDPHTPMEETLEALNEVVREGKALYIGASSMWAWQFAQMLAISKANGWARFVTMQNHYNLLYREEEREMNPLCCAEGVGLIPWSPLARGLLAGNRKAQTVRSKTDPFSTTLYGKETSSADQRVVDRLEEVGRERGIPAAQIALAWLLHRPGLVAPIVGASKPQHLEDAIASIQVKLSAEEIARLEEPYIPHEIAGLEIVTPKR
jgi:aryl-alcohol dehydrogenase-like predicted oxidoreductase